MTSVDVLSPNPVLCPAQAALPPHAPDAANKLSACLSEALPSPPESSAKLEQQNRSTDAHPASNTLPADTPDPSPASCTASLEAGSGKLRKRVDFSLWTVSTDLTDPETSIRSLPPSRECQSSKSILKPGRPLLLVQGEINERTGDLATMLDTILRQLANADRRMRLDAYSTLLSAFKAYAELPDSHISKEKVQALLEFIKRDLTHQIGEHMEPSETNLMLQAVKLLVTIVWTKTLSVHLTDTYRSFIIDHSTRILEERKVSKALLLHYMHLLSTQDFSNRIMTAGRAVRLLEVLKDLPEHVRGNGVISERLMAYQRVSEQAKGTFKSRPSCWVSQLLFAMICSVPDTRKKAITLGYRLPVALGSSSTVATALRDLLDSPGEQEDVLSSTICKRLVKMIKSVDEARQVPQIWAVVMLLMRGLEQKFHEWHRLHEWLRIIQKCFNCSDSEVRVAANKAWNKLVCVARPYGETKSFLTKMLIKPVLVQLERPSNEKQSRGTRNSAFASYCNLLYYALRPSASSSHNDAVWDEYIVPAFKAPFLSTEQNSDCACRILIALFWRDKISPWRETRALDAVAVEPEELPLLDCKWIRSRTRSILEVFELLFRSSHWGRAAYPDTAYIAAAWRNFAKGLGDACRKEVRASAETMEAVTHLSRFLIRLCTKPSAAVKEAEKDYVSRFHFICKTILLEVGPLLFAEGALSNAIDGPSIARNAEPKSKGRPPMVDILEAVQNLPSSFKNGVYFDMVLDLLQLTSKARSSVNGRIYFYKQCAEVIMLDGSGDAGNRLTWKAIAKLACDDMKNSAINSSSNSGDAGHTVANAVKILELSIPYQKGPYEAWSKLLKQSFLVADSHQSGLVVTDRLTVCLRNHITDEGGLCTAVLVQEFLEAVNSSVSFSVRKPFPKRTKRKEPEVMSVYRCLVDLMDLHLSRIYGLADCDDEAVLQSVIHAAISLLQACPTEYTLTCLTGMQRSLALWLEDEQRLMATASPAGNLKLLQARKLCPVVVDVLGKLSKEIDLQALDSLFAAAFRTSHRITINQMVKMWNSTYGTSKSLEYGDMLKEALARLMPFVDLELPGLHDLESHGTSPRRLDYLESPEEDEGRRSSEESAVSSEIDQPMDLPGDGVQKGPCGATDAAGTRTPEKEGSKTRLHHDDSQVQFVSIASSPLPGENAESQNLTARQKEVRERQDREAALLFPDLRSSPSPGIGAPKTAKESTSPVLPGEGDGLLEIAHPATPTLPSRRIVSYEEAAQCSPTPKSKQQALRFDEIDAPSSPLSMHGPVDGVDQSEAVVQSSCQNEVQNETKNGRLTEVGLFEDIPEESRIFENDMEDPLPNGREASRTASSLVEQFPDHTQSVQISSGSLAADIADTAEDMPMAESQVGDDISFVKAAMQDSVADGMVDHRLLIGEHFERTLDQGPEIAGSLLQTAENPPDVEMTGIPPRTDGSDEKHLETIFQTPIYAGSPPDEQMKIFSDDNDFWSASQLSRDLERAASSAPSQTSGPQPDSAPPAPGKRKRSPAASQGSKRRKTTGDFTRPRARPRLSSGTTEVQSLEPIYDCIEVETPSSSQQSTRATSASSQGSVVSQPHKRGRGRPRKTQPLVEMPGPSGKGETLDEDNKSASHDTWPKVEVGIPSRGGSRQKLSAVSTESYASPSHPKDHADRVLNAGTGSNRDSTARRVSMEVKVDDKENQVSPAEAMGLLQKALSSLRETSMDRSDLRAIDDLVFEIRTEAQYAAQRSGRSGT